MNELPPLLEITDATVVKNGRRVLDALSLRVAQGQHSAVLGPNGSGKSSLIRLITRQDYPLLRAGDALPVMLFGQSRWNVFELRSRMGIVSAELHSSFASGAITGRDAVLSGFFASRGLARHHVTTPAMRDAANAALSLMDAAHLAERTLDTLSTGEARRVLIARSLAPDPQALLLDEPTTGLDVVARRGFLNTLRRVARAGKTVVLVTHHAEEILPEIERVVLLREGRVFADGPRARVLTGDNLSAVFGAPLRVREAAGFYSLEAEAPP